MYICLQNADFYRANILPIYSRSTLLALFTWKVDNCEIVIHATWEIRIFATSNIDFTRLQPLVYWFLLK